MLLYTNPPNPIAAVTHVNPYPYYADLIAHKPLYYDETCGYWIASSAKAVKSVITSELCRVRPKTEPVPRSLVGAAADVFRYLIRMNDGECHHHVKQAVSATFVSIDPTRAAQQATKWAQFLLGRIQPDIYPDRLSDFTFQLPLYVVATLLGVPENKLSQIALWIGEFVACLAPASSQEHIRHGKMAASNLLDLFHSLLTAQQSESSDGLLATLARETNSVGRDDKHLIVANAIGFLSQAYEATAGLIGNTLVALASDNHVREFIMAYPELLNPVIQEVLRFDSPIQNTRRFLSHSGIIAGQNMTEGDMVLVLLGAANRDPALNPNPDQFDVFRKYRHILTFGVGVHACPGEKLATIIATAAVELLLASGIELDQPKQNVKYRPSGNARIPLFERQ